MGSTAAAERGEAANREHQLLDYLHGRNVKSGADKNRSSEAGRTSVNSQYPDRSFSEVRSFDETTIQPSVRRPAKYYQSNDDSDNSNFDSLEGDWSTALSCTQIKYVTSEKIIG